MVFSSLVFLFFFLPIVIITYFLVPFKLKNVILLVSSLFFYAWGEPKYVFLMLLSIVMNFIFGIFIAKKHANVKSKNFLMFLTVVTNLAILGFYKYANFFVENINHLFGTSIHLDPIPLPIGISFFTFQAMSYVIDVYRNHHVVQRNVFDLALYISFFPQLVAGPIVRYDTIADQLKKRIHSFEHFSNGVQIFIMGLGKKVLIANPLGALADSIFSQPTFQLSIGMAWLGVIAYTLQIFFDFSGYSQMAIGLGKMFGFDFPTNFNYPYISQSISEFWRRWHMTLGQWFRDYVYIPLGGSRVDAKWKLYRNLFIVWLLTGFWHGASWTFIAWGLYYGFFISIEKMGLEKMMGKVWRPIRHFYVLFIVMIGWLFFRADNFPYALSYLKTMFAGNELVDAHFWYSIANNGFLLVLAIIFSLPIIKLFKKLENKLPVFISGSIAFIFYSFVFIEILLYLTNETYNPFIYFRF